MRTALPEPAAGSPLATALEKSDAIGQAVEGAADELLVIHAVLSEEVPTEAQTPVVVQALSHASVLEDKLQASAADLAHVTELLQQEVAERADLEQKLADTKKALRAAH